MYHTRETPDLGNLKKLQEVTGICVCITGISPGRRDYSLFWAASSRSKGKYLFFAAWNISKGGDITLPTKVCLVKSGFSSSHVWMWELNHKESCHKGKGGMIWENSIETCIWAYVKQITSPGLILETGAQGWCTGMTQRDGMGREVEEGLRMGNTCTPMADSCQCMAKPIE